MTTDTTINVKTDIAIEMESQFVQKLLLIQRRYSLKNIYSLKRVIIWLLNQVPKGP